MLSVSEGLAREAYPAAAPALTPEALGLSGLPSEHRIVVAMSGGVDSSLAAALIAAAGYETVGITLQLYDHGAATARKGACCAGRDIMDARRVADAAGIAHYVLNYEDRFQEFGHLRFRIELSRGRNADPLRALQSDRKIFRSFEDRPRAWRLGTGHGALCAKQARA